MSDKSKLILIVVVFIGAVGLLSLYFISIESKRATPSAGSNADAAAQDFRLLALRGDYVNLSDYRGKVVFLNIWATWCPPCQEEMPSLESLYQRLKGRKFEMLTVCIDREGEEVVRPFVTKLGLTFPVLLDPEGKTYRLYRLTGVPESFIIDKSGVIIRKIIGPQYWTTNEWLDYFDRIIPNG
jgi:peroxiredoxin